MSFFIKSNFNIFPTATALCQISINTYYLLQLIKTNLFVDVHLMYYVYAIHCVYINTYRYILILNYANLKKAKPFI